MKNIYLIFLLFTPGYISFGSEKKQELSFKEKICAESQIEKIKASLVEHRTNITEICEQALLEPGANKANKAGIVKDNQFSIDGSRNPELLHFDNMVLFLFKEDMKEIESLINNLQRRGLESKDIQIIQFYFYSNNYKAFERKIIAKRKNVFAGGDNEETKEKARLLFSKNTLNEKEIKENIEKYETETRQAYIDCETEWVSRILHKLTKQSRRVLYSYIYEVVAPARTTLFFHDNSNVNSIYDYLYKGKTISELKKNAKMQAARREIMEEQQ